MSATSPGAIEPAPDAPGTGRGARVVPPAAALFVLAAIFIHCRLEWRHFDQLLGDDGWCFQIASRVASGEQLYTEIGWPYGPLPVYVMAALFRETPSLAWGSLVTGMLGVAAIAAVYGLARSLLGRNAAAVVTAWSALLGAPMSLLTFGWQAYTPSLAWGTTCSLLATAAAAHWVTGRSPGALFACAAAAALAGLAKPEFGLAALGVVSAACWLRRPRWPHLLPILIFLVLPAAALSLHAGPTTLGAWWRGYAGYDLIRVGQVELTLGIGLLGRLAVPLLLVCGLRWRAAAWLLAACGAILAGVWVKDVAFGTRTLSPATNDVLAAAWLGALPALLWLGYRARGRALPRAFWVLWVDAILVNLRWFLLGEFAAAAAAPVVVLAIVAVRRGLITRPARPALAVLAAVVLVPAFAAEKRAIDGARHAVPVATELGIARVPPHHASTIEAGLAWLANAPPGPLFVAGGGPGWYVLSGRRNPAAFDVLLRGLGTTEPERSRLRARLAADPPTVVVAEWERGEPPAFTLESVEEATGQRFALQTSLAGGRWQFFTRR